MGKKKKRVLLPWCWYCEREFESERVLIDHQKSRHFKCPQCNRKFASANAMAIHLETVHKQTLQKVPNAIEGRDTIEIQIFGMSGIPVADLETHEQKITGKGPSSKRIAPAGGVSEILQPEMPFMPPSLPGYQGYMHLPVNHGMPQMAPMIPVQQITSPLHMMPPGAPFQQSFTVPSQAVDPPNAVVETKYVEPEVSEAKKELTVLLVVQDLEESIEEARSRVGRYSWVP